MGNRAAQGVDAFSPFPPAGFVTNHEAARRLGVSLLTLTCGAWKWQAMLREGSRCVRVPGGGRANIYSVETIARVLAAQAEGRAVTIPEGFVDKDGACRVMGVSRSVWKHWVRQGKVRFGQTVPVSAVMRKTIYAVADLERLREELFGEDKLYLGADCQWHVPAGFVRREEAWERFGVGRPTWERWEHEGKVTCGERKGGGPKLYRVEDINALLDEYGRLASPYPDPTDPAVYRVPLSGRDIRRREAVIDAASAPLIEGGSCAWSPHEESGFVTFTRGAVKSVPLRRVILGVMDQPINVRHVNGDPFDCRRENLVVRTVAERVQNKRKVRAVRGRPTSSRFKGVYLEAWTGRWRAAIKSGEKTRYLGRFNDELAAAEAYDEAARELFGEHARLNFPEPGGVGAWLARVAEMDEQVSEADERDEPFDENEGLARAA